MERITSLDTIKKITTYQSARDYAFARLGEEKKNCSLTTMNAASGEVKNTKPEYYEYMRQTWHWEKNPTLEACIDNSITSKMLEYAEMVKLYAGWIKNGRLFVLNKKGKYVSFLYEVKREFAFLDSKPISAMLYTHYNPLNVDCIEESVKHEYLFDGIMSDTYDISVYEEEMIKACDLLIKG